MKAPRAKTKHYEDAHDIIQSACNMGGVAKFLDYLLTDLSESGCDTRQRHEDPAVVLTVAKLADLCGLEYEWPRDAEDECREIIKELKALRCENQS